MKNYYSILGIDCDATPEQIKRAYREKSMQHHPDKGGTKAGFQLLLEAFSTLSDPSQREGYDAALSAYEMSGDMPPASQPVAALTPYGVPNSQRFRSLYSAIYAEYTVLPPNAREKNQSFQFNKKQNYFYIELTPGKVSHYKSIYDYIALKDHKKDNQENLQEQPVTYTPKQSIEQLRLFLKGDLYASALTHTLTNLDLSITLAEQQKQRPQLRLFQGITIIISMTSDTFNSERLFQAYRYIQEYASINPQFCLDLYNNALFKNLFLYALEQYWSAPSIISPSLLKDMLSDSILEDLKNSAKQLLIESRNEYVKVYLDMIILLKRLRQYLDDVMVDIESAESAREAAYEIYNWFPALSYIVPNEFLMHLLVQLGCYFQLAASRDSDSTARMTDEAMAINVYAAAVQEVSRLDGQLQLYLGTYLLHLLNQCQYDTPRLHWLISNLQRRTKLLASVLPISQAIEDIYSSINLLSKSKLWINQLLHGLGEKVMQALTDLKHIPNDNEVSTLYLTFEAFLQNWFAVPFNSETGQQLRERLMWVLLRKHGMNFLDIEQHFSSPWHTWNRDNQGWLIKHNELRFINEKSGFSSIKGISINVLSEQNEELLKFYVSKDQNRKPVLLKQDIQEIFTKGIGSFILSLDPPRDSQNMIYHPFQEIRILPKHAYRTRMIETALYADYLLKMLTIGAEVQGVAPFNLRDIQKLIQTLPNHLKRIINEFHAQERPTHQIHRFWIEANPIEVAFKEIRDPETGALKTLSLALGQPTMSIQKHLMVRDAEGNLIDADENEEGHPIYVIKSEEVLKLKDPESYHSLNIKHPAIIVVEGTKEAYVTQSFTVSPKFILPDTLDIDYLFHLSRDEFGKVISPKSEDYAFYHCVRQLTEVLHVPHYFTPEYVFATEMTAHYDEFALYFSEFERLKALTTVTVAVRMLSNLRHNITASIERMQKLLVDRAYWDAEPGRLQDDRDFKKQRKDFLMPILKDIKNKPGDFRNLYNLTEYILSIVFVIYERKRRIYLNRYEVDYNLSSNETHTIVSTIIENLPIFPLSVGDIDSMNLFALEKSKLKKEAYNSLEMYVNSYEKFVRRTIPKDKKGLIRNIPFKDNIRIFMSHPLINFIHNHIKLNQLFQELPYADKLDLKSIVFNEWGAFFASQRIVQAYIPFYAQKLVELRQEKMNEEIERLKKTLKAIEELGYPLEPVDSNEVHQELLVPAAIRHHEKAHAATLSYGGVSITPDTIIVEGPEAEKFFNHLAETHDDPPNNNSDTAGASSAEIENVSEVTTKQLRRLFENRWFVYVKISQFEELRDKSTRLVKPKKQMENTCREAESKLAKAQSNAENCKKEAEAAANAAAIDPSNENYQIYREKVREYESAEEAVHVAQTEYDEVISDNRIATQKVILDIRKLDEKYPSADSPHDYSGFSRYRFFNPGAAKTDASKDTSEAGAASAAKAEPKSEYRGYAAPAKAPSKKQAVPAAAGGGGSSGESSDDSSDEDIDLAERVFRELFSETKDKRSNKKGKTVGGKGKSSTSGDDVHGKRLAAAAPSGGRDVSGSGSGAGYERPLSPLVPAEKLFFLSAPSSDNIIASGREESSGVDSGDKGVRAKSPSASGVSLFGEDAHPSGSVGASRVWTVKARLKAAQLPIEGKIRYLPPKGYHPSEPIPKAPGGIGYWDKFGNIWIKGPSRTAGQAFEWDIQLSSTGQKQLGWASRDGKHINVSLDGRLTHR